MFPYGFDGVEIGAKIWANTFPAKVIFLDF